MTGDFMAEDKGRGSQRDILHAMKGEASAQNTLLKDLLNQRENIFSFTQEILEEKVDLEILVRTIKKKVMRALELIDEYLKATHIILEVEWHKDFGGLEAGIMRFFMAYLLSLAKGDQNKKVEYDAYFAKGYKAGVNSLASEMFDIYITVSQSYNEIFSYQFKDPKLQELREAFLNYYSDLRFLLLKTNVFLSSLQQPHSLQASHVAKQQLDDAAQKAIAAATMVKQEEAQNEGQELSIFSLS